MPERPAERPPFALRRLDHIVLRTRDFAASYAFYTRVLGCTVDESGDVGRFAGVLTHLRAGDAYIDLLAYDPGALGEGGEQALLSMHGGGGGSSAASVAELAGRLTTDGSTLDHVCIRVDPFDEAAMLAYFESVGVEVVGHGPRKGAEGVGPSVYVKDPDGNVVELKGPPTS